MPEHGARTGDVFIRNFDQGVIETLGGYIGVPDTEELIAMLGGEKKTYFIDIPEAVPSKVPVVFGNPEAVLQKKIYPSFLVLRDDPVPAMSRWHSIGSQKYRVPSVGAVVEVIGGVSGYSEYETAPQDQPYDLTYQIQVMARYEHQSIPMLKKVLRTYPPYSKINLIDSLGQARSYTVFQESLNDISELIDVADRMKGWSVTIRVEGELTLNDISTSPSVIGIAVSGNVLT